MSNASYSWAVSLALAALAFSAPVAQAAVITNMTGDPQIIEVETAGGFAPVSIARGQTYRMPGKLTVRAQGHVLRIEDSEEYAIWGDGALVSQKRGGNGGNYK